MDDGAYASVFYGLTGLHGLHVLVGLLLLALVLGKLLGGSFDRDANPHVLFTAALWYWHFVDLVWIGLYLVVYLWGNTSGDLLLPVFPRKNSFTPAEKYLLKALSESVTMPRFGRLLCPTPSLPILRYFFPC